MLIYTTSMTHPDPRDPSREIQIHLTGNMARYMWSFDGIKFDDAKPIDLKYGERVRFTLVNDTMMTHPIHLHGVWSDLENRRSQTYTPQAYDHGTTWQPGQLSGHSRCVRKLGLSLPSFNAHDGRHVS